jgi:hypothetical protein
MVRNRGGFVQRSGMSDSVGAGDFLLAELKNCAGSVDDTA